MLVISSATSLPSGNAARPDGPNRGHHIRVDPSRRAVGAGEAARRLGAPRFSVAEEIRRGHLPGFGLRKPNASRTRWYAYEDALPAPALVDTMASLGEQRDHFRAEAAALRETLLRVLAANDKRRLGEGHRDEALRLLAQAVREATAAAELARQSEEEQEEALKQVVLPRLVESD